MQEHDEKLVPVEARETGVASDLFAALDDQRSKASHGLLIIVSGFILILLYLSGIALAPATTAILAFVAFIFVTAYVRYARHLRATRPARLAALLAKIGAAQRNGQTSAPNPGAA